MSELRPSELEQVDPSLIEEFRDVASYDEKECARIIQGIVDGLEKAGVGMRTHDELSALQHFTTPDEPGSPLVQVDRDEIGPGVVMRVWHDYLGRWATGWLEVLFVVDDRIGFRDAAGRFTVRGMGDTEGFAWRHPDLGPERLVASPPDAANEVPELTVGAGEEQPKIGRWGRCESCGAYIELMNAKEEVWDWDDIYAHAYYCPTCYTPGNIYMGQLIGANSKHVIDQITSLTSRPSPRRRRAG